MKDESIVRDVLEQMAREVVIAPVDPRPLVRRARRRLARTVTVWVAGAAVAIALVVGGTGLLRAAPPTVPTVPRPSLAPQPIPPALNNGPLTVFGFLNAVQQVDSKGAFRKPLVDCGDSCTVIMGASWTPDGTKLAFSVESCCAGGTSGDPYHGIRVLDVRTGKDRLIAPGEDFGVLDWSPDGTRIAFAYNEGSVPFIMNADGSNVKRLPVNGVAGIESIAWSPDGTSIAFSSDRGMYVERLDGSSPKALGSGRDPDWAPDGTRIAYASPDRCQIWTMSPDGTHRTEVAQMTPRPAHPDTCSLAHPGSWQPGPPGPTWSPDGRMIAFISIRGGLFTVKPDGSQMRRVTPADLYEGITWRPVP